jgi:hypothetical protein
MPQCKNCHREISNFDTDICPYCGTPHPIDDNYKTMDMTSHIDPVTGKYELYKSKSKTTAGLLCLFLGIFGAPYFYIKFPKKGLLAILATILVVGGSGSFLYFFEVLPIYLAFLTPLGVMWVYWAVYSVYFFRKDSLKDGNGEFLR